MFNEEWKRDFLSLNGWADAKETRAGEDWALRKFSRLTQNGQTVILMQSLLDTDPRATLGHKVADYVRIAEYLKSADFPAPTMIAQDIDRGVLLLEDFGDVSLHELIVENAKSVKDLYIDAARLLLRFYQEIEIGDLELPNYFDTAIYRGRRRLIDWYYPATIAKITTAELVQSYLDVWQRIETQLPTPILKFSHADYHPHNLMIKDGQIGLIDFQGAMWAPAPYDLVNLLEDARRVVPENIKKACLRVFEENLSPGEWQNFKIWYDVLAVQFHCRVIGQAVRLAVKENKTRLLEYIPNLKSYLSEELRAEALKPLAIFLNEIGLKFDESSSINLSPDLFAPDAF